MDKEERLISSLEALAEQEKKIVEALSKSRSQKKDWWDRFATISTFLSSVVIAVIGLYFTNVYNENQGRRDLEAQKDQTRILEMQTIERFIPHLTGDERTKKVALLAITSLGSPELATRFAQLNPSEGTQAAADVIMATAQSRVQGEVPTPVAATAAKASKSGWAYLGQYVAGEQRWKTRYFDFRDNETPRSLEGQTLKVRAETGELNVREGMPSPFGSFARVIDVLSPGSQVKTEEVREWQSSGYMWARVSYGTR